MSALLVSSCGPSPPEAVYSDTNTGFTAIQAHAKDNGYAFIRRDKTPTRVLYVCDRAGKYDNRGKKAYVNESNRRKHTGSKKTDCKMRVSLVKDKISEQWKLSVVNEEHNHTRTTDSAAHSAHRLAAIPAETISLIDSYAKSGLTNAQVITTLRSQDIGVVLTSKDVSNVVQKARSRELNGMSPIRWLLKELEDHDYSPAYEPKSGHLRQLFFVAPTSIQLWKQHSDVLLLDCTYKTNRFNMPLLNICGITGNNMVVQLGICFLSGETENDYTWAITQLKAIMSRHMIQEPISIVTDRELALIRCLDTQFPSARHILCRWHVNMNVLAKTKKFFPGPIKDANGVWTRHPRFQSFLSSWNILLNSATEQLYDDLLLDMHSQYPASAMSYIVGTWLLWKEKLVAFWVNQAFHFGVTVTSPIEGCHATLKRYLQRGHGDLRGVFLKLQLFWETQIENIRVGTAKQQFRPQHSINTPLFAAVLHQVHGYALLKINQEQSKLSGNGQPPQNACSCVIQQSLGLPCYHKIFQRKRDYGCILLEDIHYHWWYHRPESDTCALISCPPLLPLLNPLKVKGKGRPKGALGGGNRARVAPSNTRREPSLFEIPSSSAPAALTSAPQRFLVQNGPSTTAITMQRLSCGHHDQYEPGTRLERTYMQGMASIYQTDSMEDAAMFAASAIQSAMDNTIQFLEGREDCGPSEEEDSDTRFAIDPLCPSTPVRLDTQAFGLPIRSSPIGPLAESSQRYRGLRESQLSDTDAPFSLDPQWE